MMTMRACLLGCLLALVPLPGYGSDPAFDWPEIENTHRPGAIWWWPGSAVDKANLTAELEAMRAASMGGATVVATYGAKGAEDRYIDYLSPKWLEMFTHAVREAERLGMWLDLTPGTGWPFGGPMVGVEHFDARATWEAGELGLEFSGRRVKRAAPGGEGYALNPFSPGSMSTYLTHFAAAFRAADDLDLPRAFYHDSFEYNGNWSPGLLKAFRELRGYDLEPHLPVLFDEQELAEAGRIKSDYRETLSDLHLEYIKIWVAWAQEWGATTRNQAHGATANLLDLYAAAGIPETETFGATRFRIPGVRYEPDNISDMGSPQPMINRMAASAAHVAGKPLVASESLTWLRNHFRSSLAQAKPEIDQLFLNGINHIFFHGSVYSPVDVSWPGWLFYASLQYNPRNSIWRDASALNTYIARCQSILQSGEPDNEVALYWPVYDIWQDPDGLEQMLTVHHPEWLVDSACGEAARALQAEGLGYDFISDRQLQAGLASSYRAVVVPKTQFMPVETLKSLVALARTTSTPVLFVNAPPDRVPGYLNWEARESELKSVLQSVDWPVISLEHLRKAFREHTEAKREPMVRRGLEFIRRKHEDGYHYFVANMGSTPNDPWIPLGSAFTSVVIMDPQTGKTGLATTRGYKEIFLSLQPGETRILRTFTTQKVEGSTWPLWVPSGAPSHQVKGQWQVEFVQGQPDLPQSFSTRILGSWTAAPDPEAERFAGTARYSIAFDLPDADGWLLRLGDVRESAQVYLNGDFVQTLYSMPLQVEVGEYLKPGTNRLEIEVTNLSANRIRDLDRCGVDWKIFHDINFVDQHYEPFEASGWQLVPSGLLGPVSLNPLNRKDFK